MSHSPQDQAIPPGQDPDWHDVGSVLDLPEDSGLAVRVGDFRIALFRQNEDIVAVEDLCPHQGTPLAGGLVREGVLTCPLHAWQFRLKDGGNVDGGPSIRTFPVRLRDERLLVRID
ncbi:MAG: Rieske (2Fe-2S) protein [Acidobacteriota bacterium]